MSKIREIVFRLIIYKSSSNHEQIVVIRISRSLPLQYARKTLILCTFNKYLVVKVSNYRVNV